MRWTSYLVRGETVSNQPTLLPFKIDLFFVCVSTLQHITVISLNIGTDSAEPDQTPHSAAECAVWLGSSLCHSSSTTLDTSTDSRMDYSWLSLSRPRLSRITANLEVKIWSLPKHETLTCKKYCGKEETLLLRSNFSSFPQYFQYISNFMSPITHIFVKCG